MPIGRRAKSIGFHDVKGIRCTRCEVRCTHRVTVYGHYAHVILIPVLPIGTSLECECGNCSVKIGQDEFPARLRNAFHDQQDTIKQPWRHYLGIWIIGMYFIFSMLNTSKTEVDERKLRLYNDISLMTTFPSFEKDSLSVRIQSSFAELVSMDVDPSYFKYFTELQGDKILILVTIPELNRIREDELKLIIEIIEVVTDFRVECIVRDLFIGVRDNRRLLAIKTPTYHNWGDDVSETALYEFYGSRKK